MAVFKAHNLDPTTYLWLAEWQPLKDVHVLIPSTYEHDTWQRRIKVAGGIKDANQMTLK